MRNKNTVCAIKIPYAKSEEHFGRNENSKIKAQTAKQTYIKGVRKPYKNSDFKFPKHLRKYFEHLVGFQAWNIMQHGSITPEQMQQTLAQLQQQVQALQQAQANQAQHLQASNAAISMAGISRSAEVFTPRRRVTGMYSSPLATQANGLLQAQRGPSSLHLVCLGLSLGWRFVLYRSVQYWRCPDKTITTCAL